MEMCGQLHTLAALTLVKEPRVPTKRLVGPQSRSGDIGEEMHHLRLPGIETRFVSRPAHRLVTILTELSERLSVIETCWKELVQRSLFFVSLFRCP
jgi:hypothetical protein